MANKDLKDLDREAFFSVTENDARPIEFDETLTPEEREKKRQEGWEEALRFAKEMDRKYGK